MSHQRQTPTSNRPFEPTSKRRKGFPSGTHVKRGDRTVRGGEIELLEQLGNNDPCPCGSGRRFQELLPQRRRLLTAPAAMTTTASADSSHIGGTRSLRARLRSSEEERRASNPEAEVRLLSGALDTVAEW